VINFFINMKYAIIQSGGKQYQVKAGDTLKIEKIIAKKDEEIELKEVFLIFDDETKAIKIGKPIVAKAVVKAKVLEQGRAQKIDVIKYKRKVRYRKKYGHRQPFTKLAITEIVG